MRESPAWAAIPHTAKRVLERIELEHMRHAGRENGRLIVTYDDFAKADIRRQSVALALRQLSALGFLEVTVSGYKTAGGDKIPSKYRLTHVFSAGAYNDGTPTEEWRRIKTNDHARSVLAAAVIEETLGSKVWGGGRRRPQSRNQ